MANKRVDIELGVKDMEGGAITRFARRLQTSLGDAGKGADEVNRKLTTLDQAVAKLPASFQQAGSLAGAALEKIGHASDAAVSRVKRLGSDLGGVFSLLTGGAKSLWNQLNSLSTALAGLGLAMVAKGFLDTASSIEKTKVLLGQLVGSAKGAEDAFAWMMKQDFTRVFGLGPISDAFVKLRAAGIDPTKGSLEALTNALAAFGKGPEDLKLATIAIQQMAGKGVISMEELRQQLAERIPTAGKIMACELGMSYADMVAMISKGNLSAQKGLNALFAGLQKDYQESVVALSQTWEGLMGRLSHWWTIFKQQTMDSGLFATLKGELQGFLNWISQANDSGALKQWAQSLADGAKDAFQKIKEWITAAVGWWRAHGESVTEIVSNTYSIVTNILQAAANIVEPVLSLLVPKADRMQGAVQGYRGIAEQIRSITDSLNSVPPWVWQALLGAYVGGRLGGGKGAALGALAGVALPRAIASLPEANQETGGYDPIEWLMRFSGFTTSRMQMEQEAQRKEAEARQTELARLMAGGANSGPAANATEKGTLPSDWGPHFLEPEAAQAKGRTKEQLAQVAELRDKISQIGLTGQALELQQLEKQRREWLTKTGNDTVLVEEYISKKAEAINAKWAQKRLDDEAKAAKKTTSEVAKVAHEYEQYERNRSRATQMVELEIAKSTGDTRKVKEIELKRYEESLMEYTSKEKGEVLSVEEVQLAVAAKRVELNKTSLDRMLEDWSRFGDSWEKVGETFLQGTQQTLTTTFKNTFEGVGSAWENLWTGMKDVSYNALAAIATRFTTWGLGNLLISVMPSLKGVVSGDQGGSGSSSWGGLARLASTAKGAYDAIKGGWSAATNWGSSALNPSLWGTRAGLGSSLVNWEAGTAPAGFMGPPAPVANGLSTFGYVSSGIGGALTGWQTAQMLYGNGTGSQVGGALGGAAGGIGGAMLGQALIPIPGVGAIIGGLAGGLLGGAGGGGLGSLFDSTDTRQPFEIPGNYQAHWEELGKRVEDYSQAVQEGTISQEDFLAEMDKMAPLAAGAGEYLGDYGAIIGGTIESLSGLTFGTQEYVDKVNNELNPAWIISTGLAQNLANGMNNLEAHKKALTDAIDSLAASSSLSAEQQSGLIDLIIEQSGSVADLTDKYNRYNEIKDQLTHANTMERGEVEALGAELRNLHDELGIGDTAMGNLNKTVDKLTDAVDKLAGALNGLPTSKSISLEYSSGALYHTGGLVLHSGGLVSSAAARRGMTGPARGYAHGPVPRMHSGGSWPGLSWDERPAILQLGEHVTRRTSVNSQTRPVLEFINRTGQVPQAAAAGGGGGVSVAVTLQVNGPMVHAQGGEVDPQALANALGPAIVEKVKAGLREASRNGEVVVFAEGVAPAER